MRHGLPLALLVFVALVAAGGSPPHAGSAPAGPAVDSAVVQALGRQASVGVIVSLREPPALRTAALDVAALRSQVATAQAQLLSTLPPKGFQPTYRYQAVPAIAGRLNKNGLAALSYRSDVAEVMLDGVSDASTAQSVPLIHADDVQHAGVTGLGTIVAVLDTGIDTDHPDLANGIAYERCFLTGHTCPPAPHVAEDDNGHGTNVAGIITDDGVVAPAGVAPGAKIAVYKVLTNTGSGLFSDWLAGLDDIITNHPEVNIVNLSLQSNSPCPGGALDTAVATLRKRGTATFVAAGNHGDKGTLTIPACLAGAISVGATYDASIGHVDGWKADCSDPTTSADMVACWSDSSPALALLAPGDAITAAGMGGGLSTFYGTSQASPHAAGVAALVLQAHPGLSVDELEARMQATGSLVTDDLHDADPSTNRTTPRIDARVALLSDSADTDGDGCTDAEELGPDPGLGGQRNPLNPWDFYDVNGDGVVNLLDDVYAVAAAFGPSSGPRYAPKLDRSPAPPGAAPWHLGPPDGTINVVGDIMGVVAQFGHRCARP